MGSNLAQYKPLADITLLVRKKRRCKFLASFIFFEKSEILNEFIFIN